MFGATSKARPHLFGRSANAFKFQAFAALMLIIAVQLDHAARPSVLFNIRDSFSDFLKDASEGKEDYPNNLESLLNQGGVKLILSDKNDPDGAGFIQWRTAFYVAGANGSVKNLLLLLDDFFSWKMKAMQKEVEVHIYQHGEQELADADDFDYEHYTLHEADEVLPLKWYECSPVISKRIVMLHLQPESETCVSVLWGGNTWNFRNALDEAGVRGAYVDEDGGNENAENNNKRKYFRILKGFDVTSEEGKVENILKEVFNNLAMKVVVEKQPVEDSDVAAWIETLRKLPNLHFES